MFIILLLICLGLVSSFERRIATSSTIYKNYGILQKLAASSERSDSDSSDIISLARKFAATLQGTKDPSILADDFTYTSPSAEITDKQQYVAEVSKSFSSVQRCMPDFDFRASSFVADDSDANTVRYITRAMGTISGPFAYNGEVYLPPSNNKPSEFAPQFNSLTFRNGKVVEYKTGFVVDRLAGNTGGLDINQGILSVLGESPNQFGYLPPAVVVKRFFARPIKQGQVKKSKSVSVLPEAVLIAVAKQVVVSKFGLEGSELLSADFQASSPLDGPVDKDTYLSTDSYNRRRAVYAAVPDIDFNAQNFFVENSEPDRVWFTTRTTGTMTEPFICGDEKSKTTPVPPTGQKFKSPLELLTTGYVVDPTVGNTDGLGDIEGILQGIGAPLPLWETKSIPAILSSPFKGLTKSKKSSSTSTPPPVSKRTAAASTPTAPVPRVVTPPKTTTTTTTTTTAATVSVPKTVSSSPPTPVKTVSLPPSPTPVKTAVAPVTKVVVADSKPNSAVPPKPVPTPVTTAKVAPVPVPVSAAPKKAPATPVTSSPSPSKPLFQFSFGAPAAKKPTITTPPSTPTTPIATTPTTTSKTAVPVKPSAAVSQQADKNTAAVTKEAVVVVNTKSTPPVTVPAPAPVVPVPVPVPVKPVVQMSRSGLSSIRPSSPPPPPTPKA
eukprot:gene8930-18470_t